MAKKTTPRLANGDDVLALTRDNVGTEDYWIITDGFTVTLACQKVGEPSTAMVSLPKVVFDAFADWYMTGNWKRPRKRGGK